MRDPGELLPQEFQYRLDLARKVTPHLLRQEPIHRWFYFQHSFSPQLVDELIDTFRLPAGSLILDPFVGAGTTLTVARQRGMHAIGTDLSPLSVIVSNAKIGTKNDPSLRAGLRTVIETFDRLGAIDVCRPSRLQRAFTDAEFSVLQRLRRAILSQPDREREFLLLALLRTARKFSRAVPDGGWFRWRQLPSGEGVIASYFREFVEEMLTDLPFVPETKGRWIAYKHDARALSDLTAREIIFSEGCDAIISSPPYPNRHDYTRIYQMELLMLGTTEEEIFELRRASLRSHPEARPPSNMPDFCSLPERLTKVLAQLPRHGLDSRVRRMLMGYFEDIAVVLGSCRKVLKPGGHLALVVGNVRHGGVMIPVDEILVEIGKRVGFNFVVTWVARLRGNSAQQMGKFGRQPARESVVIFRRERS